MPTTIASGTAIHAISSTFGSAIRAGMSCWERRRYLSAKTASSPAMSRENTAVIATRKKYTSSTIGANVDARCGKNGEFVNTLAGPPRRRRRARKRPLAPEHHGDEAGQREDGQDSAQPHDPHDRDAVAA